MVKMTRGASPRRVGGGRSDRHESRHKAQGYTRTNAPEWSIAGEKEGTYVLPEKNETNYLPDIWHRYLVHSLSKLSGR